MPRSELSDRLLDALRVDRHGDVPISTQLARALERLIEEGALRPGERLPSVRQLAETVGVNVNTVRAVYARLEQHGLLASEHGRGTFVRGGGEPTANGSERDYRRELMRQIAELERQAAYYTRHQPLAMPEGAAPRRAASQLLPATELIEIRNDLQDRVAELRRAEEERLSQIREQRAALAAEEAVERAEEVRSPARRTRGTAAEPPRIVPTPGAWVLEGPT